MSWGDTGPHADADGWIAPGSAAPSGPPAPVFRWDVTADLIDVDRMAGVALRAARHRKGSGYTTAMALILGAGVVVLALGRPGGGGRSPGSVLVMAGFAGLFAWVWGPGGRWLIARRLRRDPTSLQPFVFVAAADGTHESSPTSTVSVAWSRYRAASTVDGHLVLDPRSDVKVFHVIPWSALAPGPGPPEHVLATLQAWISAADPTRRS